MRQRVHELMSLPDPVDAPEAVLEAALGIDLPTAHKIVLSMAWSLCNRGAQEADDLTQDVFEQIFLKAQNATLVVDQNVEGFLRAATRNCFIDARRKRAAKMRGGEYVHVPLEVADPYQHPDTISVEDEAWNRNNRTRLLRAYRGLSSEQQRLIYLLYVEGMTKAAAARKMNISPNTLHDRLKRVQADLRNLMRADGGEV